MSDAEETVASIALALTSESKHPVSVAIATHLSKFPLKPAQISGPTVVVSKGIEAILTSPDVKAPGGNARWLGCEDNPHIQALLSRDLAVFCISRNSTLIGAFSLQDRLRPDAKEVVSQLRARRVDISIVSGDEENAVRGVANQLHIPARNIRFRCSPADKKRYLEELKKTSFKAVTTLFIGDGTNDAPALAQVDIGVHINDGTEVAKSASDVILLTPALDGVLVLIDLSTVVMNRVKFNFGWSFIYDTIAILLAAFVKVHIPPTYARLGELVSVLPVLAIALQLRLVKLRKA